MPFNRHDPLEGPQDLHWTQVYDYVTSIASHLPEPYNDRSYLERTCQAFTREAALFGLRTSGYCGQIMHETGVLRYPGDVDPGQLNYGGIGATGGGVKGNSFPTPEHGSRVNAEHLAVYRWGRQESWPAHLHHMRILDPRYQNVLDARWGGTVRTWIDLAGKWAEDEGGYGPGIERHANAMLNTPSREHEEGSDVLNIALASGHHNAQGGNSLEQQLVANLSERMYLHLSRQPDVEVRSLIVDGADDDELPGDGYDHRSIFRMWQEILNDWAHSGWTPQLCIEQHTQGVSNTSVRGWFGIYPDMDGDTDTDVRDRLIPIVREKIRTHTPMPIWSNGLMSEKNTGVGIGGFRLGYFSATVRLREGTERVLFESGAHTNPADRALLQNPAVVDRIAEAQVMGIMEFYGRTYVPEGREPELPPAPELPKTSRGNEVERYFEETDAGLIGAFKGRWEQLEGQGLVWQHVGFPISDEFNVPYDDIDYETLGHRTFQLFQRCAFAWNADNEGTAWNVESIFGNQYTLLKLAALENGVYIHGE